MASANSAESQAPSSDAHAPLAAPRNDHDRLTRRVVGGAILVGLVIVGLTAGTLWRLTQQQLDAGLAQLSALDLLVAAKTDQTFESAGVVLDSIGDDFLGARIASSAALTQAASDEASYRLLRAKMADVPALESLSILDAEGNVVNHTRSFPVSPPVNLADSDFFLRLRDHPELQFYVSRAPQSSADGNQPIYIAKRLSAPNGAFVGVLFGTVRRGFFESLYASNLQDMAAAGSSIALWRSDGTLLADAPAGAAVAQTADGDANRWVTGNGSTEFWQKEPRGDVAVVQRPLENFPLLLELRRPAGAILQEWNGALLATLFGGGTLLALVALAVWLLVRQLKAATLAGEERARADREALARVDIAQAMAQAENALRDAQRSESRFRDIVEVGSDWIWETDAQHRFTMIAGARRPRASLIGMTRWQQAGVDPETDATWREHKAQLDAHRPFRQFRFSIVLPTERYDVCASGKPIFDDDGTFIGYRGTVTDESELVAAREQALRADALLRNAIESIGEGFVIYDAEDRFVMCNEAYRKMYPENAEGFVPGITYKEVMRQALATGRYPDAAGREEEWLEERIRKHRAGGEDEARLADGRWVLRSERPMADGGIAGLRIDVTPLKAVQNSLRESQAMLSRAQRLSGTGSVVRNLRTDTVEWSDEMYSIFGLDRETFTPSTTNFLERVHADDRSMVKSAREAGYKGVQVPAVEFRIIRSDGTTRWVYRDVELVRGASGEVESVLTTYKDITEQREANARQHELETLLRDAIDSLSEGFAFFDRDDRLVICNEAYKRVYPAVADLIVPGITFEELVRKGMARGFYPDAHRHEEEWLAERLREHRELQQSSFEQALGDGRWVLVSERRTGSGGTAGLRIDITALKRAQESLRDNQEILNRAQQISGTGSVVRNLRTKETEWSDGMFRMFGVTRDDFTPQTDLFLATVHPDDRSRVAETIVKGANGENEPPIEFRIVRPDASVRWIYREADFWCDTHGTPVRLATYKDTTEQRAAEERQREKETILNRAQRVGRMGSIFRDFASNTSHWSDEMFRLLGVARESFTPSIPAFLAMVHPEDRAAVEKSLAATPKRNERDTVQFRIVRPDGSVCWLHREAERLFDESDKAAGALATFQDITELQQAQEALRENQAMLNRAQRVAGVGSVLHDFRTRTSQWSEQMYRITGLDPDAAPPSPARVLAIIHPEDRARVEESLRVTEAGKDPPALEYRIIRPDGSVRLLHREAEIWLDAEGRPTGRLSTFQDITEIQRAQETLRENQFMLRRAQRIAGIGIVMRKLNDSHVEWSDEMFRICGVSPDSFDSQNTDAFFALVHPDDQPPLRRAIEDNHRGRPAEALQFRIIRPDGSTRWVYREVEIFHDYAGKPSEFLTTYTDVTDHVTSEARLRELEAMLRDAIESIQAGFAIYDADDRLVICNEAYRRLYAEVADLIVPGVCFVDILRAQFARFDWPKLRGHEEEWIAEWLQQRRTITTPVEVQMQDGRWVLVSERVMSNGWLAGLRVDITPLKQVQQSLHESQLRLDRTQQIAHLGTVERNLRTEEVIWSDETYRIFGLKCDDYAPSAENLLKFVHPEDRELLRATLRRSSREHANTGLKFRIVRPTGEIRTIFSQADIICDESDEPLIVSVAMMDITDRETASLRQIELETQLRHSEKLKALGTLAGGIAHDLNNTLVPIQALSKLALKHLPTDTPARADLETIYQASLQARDLVRQILAFSRKQEIVNTPTDVGAKVREALHMLRASVPSTIDLVEHIEPLPMILADAGQLQQIVVNLVTNAAHAIGHAFGRVTVSLDEVADSKSARRSMIRLRVADTGCGMSADVMQRIFEPFFTTKGVGEGTGLGLSVAHGIVTGQGGSIDVKSAPGQGSEFTVLLPAAAVAEEDIAAVA